MLLGLKYGSTDYKSPKRTLYVHINWACPGDIFSIPLRFCDVCIDRHNVNSRKHVTLQGFLTFHVVSLSMFWQSSPNADQAGIILTWKLCHINQRLNDICYNLNKLCHKNENHGGCFQVDINDGGVILQMCEHGYAS